MNNRPAVVYLGLGSNLGDKAGNIDHAIDVLCSTADVRLRARSRNFQSAPWGVTDQDWFVNACIEIETRLEVHRLLKRCQEVESLLGRVRQRRWGPRTIDIDILDYDGMQLREPDLVLPHPRIAERAFVLVPLAEIGPLLCIEGRSVEELLRRTDTGDVTPYVEALDE